MSVALTNLDDRRWADLVEEGRALIPFYSPGWTDHNVHDPGITLLELFAWLAEMDIFRLNRIPESHLRKFLALIGMHSNPPVAALAALNLGAKADEVLELPRSVEFEAVDAFGQLTRFRSLADLKVIASQITGVQYKDAASLHDLTGQFSRGEEIVPFGPDPRVGNELYLGFSAPVPPHTPISLIFVCQDLEAGEVSRRNLLAARSAATERCSESTFLDCNSKHSPQSPPQEDEDHSPPIEHHSVRLVWEFSVSGSKWQRLDAGRGEILDDTRALTLNGRVLLNLPAPMSAMSVGKIPQSLYYVRARLVRGAYDAAPQLRHCGVNGIFAAQATSVGGVGWNISANATVTGRRPRPGRRSRMRLRFNDQFEITNLAFGDSGQSIALTVIEFRWNGPGRAGLLRVEGVRLGAGDGLANLTFQLSEAPVLPADFGVFTIENGQVVEWSLESDFDSSGRGDPSFTVDLMRGAITFGDGENGRVVPSGAPVIVRYDSTRAGDGNLAAHTITKLADTPHNHALLGQSFEKIKASLDRITNPLSASGGLAAETLTHAIGRAIEAAGQSDRAVTLGDYEALAKSTPGTQVARATARANLHPSFPCLAAQGIVTVIALPYLPLDQPVPSDGLRRAIAAHLFPRRVIGSRVEVVGPTYKTIVVSAQVKALPQTDKTEVARRIVRALNRFFDPLTGGPDGTGWPFGRDVFRSEVMQVIDDSEGVDYIQKLALATGCGEAQCGNLCLAPNELVAAGEHRIEIV